MNPCGTTPSTGTLLLRETAAGSGVFEALTGITAMPDYSAEAATDVCGDFDTGIGGYESKFKTGARTQAAMAWTINYKSGDAVQVRLKEDFDSDAAQLYRVQFPDVNSTKLDLNMLVTQWGISWPSGGGNIARNVSMEPTGAPVAYTE